MDKPNFAMLIGSKKAADETDHAGDLGMDKSGAETSAVKDMMAALKSGDAAGFGAALHDYLEICYPQLADNSESADTGSEPSDSESY